MTIELHPHRLHLLRQQWHASQPAIPLRGVYERIGCIIGGPTLCKLVRRPAPRHAPRPKATPGLLKWPKRAEDVPRLFVCVNITHTIPLLFSPVREQGRPVFDRCTGDGFLDSRPGRSPLFTGARCTVTRCTVKGAPTPGQLAQLRGIGYTFTRYGFFRTFRGCFMMSIDNLLDMAKSRNGLKSDRELADELHVRHVHPYRTKGMIPSDATAVRLAELAGVPAADALVICHMARAESEQVREAWRGMLGRAAAVLLAVFLACAPAHGGNGGNGGSVHPAPGANIHYATLYGILLRALIAPTMRLFHLFRMPMAIQCPASN